MKIRWLMLSGALIIGGILAHPKVVLAACQIGSGRKASVQVTFRGDRASGSSLTVNGKTFLRNPPQCTNPVASSTYTMSCDEASETNSADSLFAPLCGASEERGPANSTCWSCGDGSTRCDGFDWAAGTTDPFLYQNRCPLPGDPASRTSEVWQPCSYPPAGTRFTYNGYGNYTYGGGMIVVCGANHLACGASAQCQNAIYPNITNYGDSGTNLQCQTVTRTTSVTSDTDINLDARGTPTEVTGTEERALIDVGGPTDNLAPQLSTLFGGTPILNPREDLISGLFQLNLNDGRTPIPEDGRSNWGVTQIQFSASGNVLAPKSGYPLGDGYHYTVLYADQAAGTLTLKATLEDSAASGYTLHFKNLNIDPQILDFYKQSVDSNRTQLAAISCGFSLGTPRGGNFRVAVADTGTFIDPRVRKDWWKNPPPAFATAACSPKIGLVTPQLTQVCTVKATPQVAAPVKLPWLQDFLAKTTEGLPTAIRDRVRGKLGLGLIKPQQDVLKKTPYLLPIGLQYEATAPKLLPKTTQEKITKIEPLSFSANTILCYESSENENKWALPERNIISAQEIPGLNKIVQGGETYNSLFGQGSLTTSQFKFKNRYPNQLLEVKNALPCGTQHAGQDVTNRPLGTAGNQEYEITEDKAPIYYATTWIKNLGDILGYIAKGSCKIFSCSAETDTGAYVNVSTLAPYIDRAEDFIGKVGSLPKGFVNSFRPSRFVLEKTNAQLGNAFEQSLGSNSEPVAGPVVFKDAAAIEENSLLMNCAIMPSSLQTKYNLDCSNFTLAAVPDTSNWAISGDTTPPRPITDTDFMGKLKAAAEENQVPACVLEGVAMIEGGPAIKVCQPNACSAMGPMQFTTGRGPANDPTCRTCGAGYCPNAWATWGNGGDPCSYADSLSAAARKLKADGGLTAADPKTQRANIIEAGYRYYGSDKPISRLGGCSYGEYVYRNCDLSYRCQ